MGKNIPTKCTYYKWSVENKVEFVVAVTTMVLLKGEKVLTEDKNDVEKVGKNQQNLYFTD